MSFVSIANKVFGRSLVSRVQGELEKAEHLRLDLYTRIEEAEVNLDYNRRALQVCEDRIQRLKDVDRG